MTTCAISVVPVLKAGHDHAPIIKKHLRFLDMPPTNDAVRIAVPHTDGGEFVAFFRRLNAAVCQYTDENGNVVDIMMSSPSHAAFINRVVDHY